MAHGHDKGHLHSTRTRQQHTRGFTFHFSWQGPAGSTPTQRCNGDSNPTEKNGHTSSSTNSAQHRPCPGNNSIPPSLQSNTWTPITANECHLRNRPLLSVSLQRVRKHRTASMSTWAGQLPKSATQPAICQRNLTPGVPRNSRGLQRCYFGPAMGQSGQDPIPPQRLQHEQPARTAPAADPDPDPETSDSTTSSQDSSSTTDATDTASATTNNSPPPAAEQPSPPGVPQIDSRQHHPTATPAPANNVATNPTHIPRSLALPWWRRPPHHTTAKTCRVPEPPQLYQGKN